MLRSVTLLALLAAVAFPVWSFADPKTTRTLRIGSIVSPQDLKIDTAEAANMADRLVGQEARRMIYAGQPISVDDVGPPTLVRRNEIVVMTYTAGGLGLRTEGRALTAGGKGEIIQVMNLASRLTVRAVVVGHRSVEARK